MDPRLESFIKRNSKMPLSEVKLELMKQGFSSYQIENALEELRIKNRPLLKAFAVFLVLAVVVFAVGFVFVYFIQPAEKLIAGPSQSSALPETIVLESEAGVQQSSAQQTEDIVVSKDEESEISLPSQSESGSPVLIDLEEVRKLSLVQKEEAISKCSYLSVQKDDCFSLVAKTVGDPELCLKVAESSAKDNCFFFFGQSNVDFCSRISSATLRNYCTAIAEITQRIE